MKPYITKVDEDHFSRWEKTYEREQKKYEIINSNDFYDKDFRNEKFTNAVSGYYKKSSAMSNLPSVYSRKGIYPAKFHRLLKMKIIIKVFQEDIKKTMC